MNDRNIQNIKSYLQNEEVQRRISENMLLRRSEVTVTIGRAADLFGFTENQLRDWEDRGLLNPQRTTKQRQYTFNDLDKLTIIRELMDAKYAPGDIPLDIDSIWNEIYLPIDLKFSQKTDAYRSEHLHIDQRVERTDKALFWRYFASQVLRLSLMLICEDIPDTIAGLVLPLHLRDATSVPHPNELWTVGESLVGWLDRSRSIYVFLDSAPTFEYPSDFRIHALQAMKEDIPDDDIPQDNTLIIVQRKAKRLTLSSPLVKTIRRLLASLYEMEDWHSIFGRGIRDTLYPATDFTGTTSPGVLNELANMIVRLGGQTAEGKDRWFFCCILLPTDPSLPVRQQALIVQAQSRHSPYKVGATSISPDKNPDSLSLRAFQSAHIIYRPEISLAEATIAYREKEKEVRSAMAVSVGGEKGQPVAVLYIVSKEARAFSKNDQPMLRLMGRIIEELLLTYRARQQVTENLESLLTGPEVVDPLFEDFLSENDFRRDVEEILMEIRKRMDERDEQIHGEGILISDNSALNNAEPPSDDVISFIGVDIDNESELAIKYGDQMTRNLSRTIGLRLREMLTSLFTKHKDCKLYHIYGNRFYLLLNQIPLEQAREKAESMRQAFENGISINQFMLKNIVLSDVTTRLGVSSYTYAKLEENLASDNPIDIVAEVKAKIARALDVALKMGIDERGNVVIAWKRDNIGGGSFVRWSPPKVKYSYRPDILS